MYILEISLKFTPMPVSVQRKEAEAAQATYQQVVEALQSGQPSVLELNCEFQAEKKLAVLTSEIASVQLYEKSGGSATVKRPGFAVIGE
ncbi:hypothetical protein [Synechococcus elongatus]|uniref:UPF0367 protein EKO22_03345 n=1 Tax=Synechococcus elongatus PCC 11802 TaxID=2283154 RepID=A0AAT9JQN6_SYNEL|nr:hypothetical protein [Synechococcus elongatus]QFZ92766.1 hypothetical protein EKO22_10885 [Synechococcus elongatus PCC 11802]